MGKTLTRISFWDSDFPIKEVVESSDIKYFNLTNLKELRTKKISLSRIENTNMYHAELNNDYRQFIVFE